MRALADVFGAPAYVNEFPFNTAYTEAAAAVARVALDLHFSARHTGDAVLLGTVGILDLCCLASICCIQVTALM